MNHLFQTHIENEMTIILIFDLKTHFFPVKILISMFSKYTKLLNILEFYFCSFYLVFLIVTIECLCYRCLVNGM